MKLKLPKPAEVRKLVVFLLTILGNALALGLVPEAYQVYAFLVVNTAGAYGVWRVPNDDVKATL